MATKPQVKGWYSPTIGRCDVKSFTRQRDYLPAHRLNVAQVPVERHALHRAFSRNTINGDQNALPTRLQRTPRGRVRGVQW